MEERGTPKTVHVQGIDINTNTTLLPPLPGKSIRVTPTVTPDLSAGNGEREAHAL